MAYKTTYNEYFTTVEGEELESVVTIVTSGGSRFQIAAHSSQYFVFAEEPGGYRRVPGIFDYVHEVLKTLPPPSTVRTRRPSSSRSIFRPDVS